LTAGAKATLLFLGGLVAVGLLPVAGRAARSGGDPRCAFDGVVLPGAPAARIVAADGRDLPFCCVTCADRWLGRQSGEPRRILVRDETSGAEVPAAEAHFVESRVVAFAVTGCRIHAFAERADAERHREAFGGRLLEDGRRPLAGAGKETR
jgi:hypothetical protein